MNYIYSLNNSDYHEKEDIIEIIKQTDDVKTVYRGEKINYTHDDFVSGRDIVENIAEAAYDIADEYSENYTESIDNDKVSDAIKEVVLKYLNENVPQPSFFRIDDVVKMSVEEFKNNPEGVYPSVKTF